jgi:hypothetical protein
MSKINFTRISLVAFLFLVILIIGIIYNKSRENNINANIVNTNQTVVSVSSKSANEPYFAPDIYIVPSTAKLAHNKFTPDYMPFESAIPAIDILRANNQLQTPSYLKQVILHNTNPYSSRMIL